MSTNEFSYTQREDKKLIQTYQKMMLILFAVVIIMSVVLGLANHAKDIITVTQDDILIFAPENGQEQRIAISEIDSLTLLDQLTIVDDGNAAEGTGYTYGSGEIEQIGTVYYYDYSAAKNYIVLESEENCIVFNYLTTENTSGFYEGLLALMDEG
jgi:hypothetical protein